MGKSRFLGLRRFFGACWIASVLIAVKVALASVDAIHAGLLIALALLAYLASWGLQFALVRESRKSLLIGFGVCTFSIGVCFGLVEVPGLFGVVDYRIFFGTPAPAWNRPGNRPDPELLFVHEGRQTLKWRFQGNDLHRLKGMSRAKTYETDLKLDSYGFRNSSELTTAGIVLIGDSFIEGPHSDQPRLISTQLQRITNRSTANFGRSGYGPIQEAVVLKRYALPLHPQDVVWAFYEGNDLADIREFPSAMAKLLSEKKPTRMERAYDRSFLRNSLEFSIRTWLQTEAVRNPNDYLGRFESSAGEDLSFYFSSDDYNPASGPRAGSPELDQFGAILKTAETLCLAQGARLSVVFIPTKWRVYRERCSFDPKARCLAWKIDDLPQALRSLATSTSSSIRYLDLTPDFEDAAQSGKVVYLPDDTHWSDEGHDVAASAIARFLSTQKPLDSPAD